MPAGNPLVGERYSTPNGSVIEIIFNVNLGRNAFSFKGITPQFGRITSDLSESSGWTLLTPVVAYGGGLHELAPPQPLAITFVPSPGVPADVLQPVPAPPVPVASIPEASPVTQADFYGFDTPTSYHSNGYGPPTLQAQPVSLGGAIVPVGGQAGRVALTQLAGTAIGGRLVAFFAGVARGGIVRWNSLPGWARLGLGALGFTGYDLLLDGDLVGLPSFGGGAGGQLDIQVGRSYDGRIITKTWVANGIQFWATGSGRDLMHHVLRKDGSIKSWKPPRPIVLMPGGAKNIRDLLRADDIIDRQLKKVGKALRRRSPTKRAPRQPQQVVVVDPQHAVLH